MALSADSMLKLAAAFPHLRSLDLKRCRRCPPAQLRQLAALPRLASLALAHDCDEGGALELAATLGSLSSLTALDLEG